MIFRRHLQMMQQHLMSINWKHFHLSEERKSQQDHLVLVSVLGLVLVLVLISGILQVDKVPGLPAKSSLVFMTNHTSRLDDLVVDVVHWQNPGV